MFKVYSHMSEFHPQTFINSIDTYEKQKGVSVCLMFVDCFEVCECRLIQREVAVLFCKACVCMCFCPLQRSWSLSSFALNRIITTVRLTRPMENETQCKWEHLYSLLRSRLISLPRSFTLVVRGIEGKWGHSGIFESRTLDASNCHSKPFSSCIFVIDSTGHNVTHSK